MISREPLDDTDVEVSSPRSPDGRRYGYSSAADARNHADEWVALGIAFTTNGTHWTDVRHAARTVRVRGYDDGQVSVYEQTPGGRREWDREEIVQTLDQHGLQRQTPRWRRGRS